MISIIVPIYNAETFLDKCLESLKNQTYSDIEVLMINDGSTDNSSEICLKYSNSDERFKYFYQSNSGVSSARNAGLLHAKGEYIGFCDSDDWVDRDMYEFLLNNLLQTNSDVSICSSYSDTIYCEDSVIPADSNTYLFKNTEAIAEMHIGEKFAGHSWDKLIKREVIGELRFPCDIAIFEDMIFMWDVFHRSNSVVYKNVKKYHYLSNPNSAIHKFKESYWSIQKASNAMLERMQRFYPDMMAYAQRTALLSGVKIADMLFDLGELNKDNYKRIIAQMKKAYNSKSIALFKKGKRIRIKALIKSRNIYILFKKIHKKHGGK